MTEKAVKRARVGFYALAAISLLSAFILPIMLFAHWLAVSIGHGLLTLERNWRVAGALGFASGIGLLALGLHMTGFGFGQGTFSTAGSVAGGTGTMLAASSGVISVGVVLATKGPRWAKVLGRASVLVFLLSFYAMEGIRQEAVSGLLLLSGAFLTIGALAAASKTWMETSTRASGRT